MGNALLSPSQPSKGWFHPTLSDTDDEEFTFRQILWLADGDITFVCDDDSEVTLTRTAGQTLPWATHMKRIMSTGTDLESTEIWCGR